ncbi:hypothetical protein A7R75_12475 [Mycolicibacterium llatzerense]|nr:hypothetical protein [Mycolicibacterium llatzerense]
MELDVPRDRASTFEPQIVKKRQRRLSGVNEVVLSLYAKGLTTGEISAHFAEIYGASVSKETISRIRTSSTSAANLNIKWPSVGVTTSVRGRARAHGGPNCLARVTVTVAGLVR